MNEKQTHPSVTTANYMLIQVYVFQAINESCQGLFGMYQHYPQFPTQQNKTLEKII